MAPINGLMAFRLISTWHEIPIIRQRLEAQYLGEDVGCDRHPPFATFREKVLFRPVNYSDAAVADPVRARVNNFYIPQSEPRKKKMRDINRGIFGR